MILFAALNGFTPDADSVCRLLHATHGIGVKVLIEHRLYFLHIACGQVKKYIRMHEAILSDDELRSKVMQMTLFNKPESSVKSQSQWTSAK